MMKGQDPDAPEEEVDEDEDDDEEVEDADGDGRRRLGLHGVRRWFGDFVSAVTNKVVFSSLPFGTRQISRVSLPSALADFDLRAFSILSVRSSACSAKPGRTIAASR